MNNQTTIRIAYAEDQQLIRKAVIEMIHLSDNRFKVVIEAANGQELLDKIASSNFQPDVCLLDVGMPVVDGFETMIRIKAKYPYIRCLTITSHGNDYPVLSMIQRGALGYVTKNADPRELRMAILEVYENHHYFSEEVIQSVPLLSKENVIELCHSIFKDREVEFLSLCTSDLSFADIAKEMNLSCRTVESYSIRLREKLNINSRLGLAIYALRSGIGKFTGVPGYSYRGY